MNAEVLVGLAAVHGRMAARFVAFSLRCYNNKDASARVETRYVDPLVITLPPGAGGLSSMKKRQSSITAEGIALVRAMESERPADVRICHDPLAKYFSSSALMLLARFFLKIGYAERRGPGTYEFLVTRCRHIDEYLHSSLTDGLQQLVILGAGYDSRAYRFDALKRGIKVFEVDHPATQAKKVERLTKVLGARPNHVVYVPVDLQTQSLEERLRASGYDTDAKTLFIWEGVVEYLAPDAVDSTLAFVANRSRPGSRIIFDYVYASVIDGRVKRGEAASMARSSRFTGEGLVFGIEEGTIEEFLSQRGFTQIQNATSRDLDRLYLTGANQGRHVAPVYAVVSATVRPRP